MCERFWQAAVLGLTVSPWRSVLFAFDLLIHNGKHCRSESLLDRKQELRRVLARIPLHSPLKYADHLVGSGIAPFQHVCELDLEGIVAKHQSVPYATDRESSTWFKILNREYSQREGREEPFERDRRTALFPAGTLTRLYVKS
jgi:ATP-dependent DNA ligase